MKTSIYFLSLSIWIISLNVSTLEYLNYQFWNSFSLLSLLFTVIHSQFSLEMATNYEGHQLTITSEITRRDFFGMMDRLRKERKLCDIILIAGNTEIPAHKCVLAFRSPYFYSMFVNSPCKTEERIKMDVNPEMLLLIIDYLYTSHLTVTEQALKHTLEIAKLLLLDNIQVECCNFLKRIINANNSFYVKSLAVAYGNSKLLTEISSFIDANFANIATSDEFLNLTNDEVKDLICRDSLRVPREENVYECVLSWIKYDLEGRRKYVRFLMEHVRFPFISKQYLSEHIVNDPLLAGDIYYKDLIIKALLKNQSDSSLELKHRKYARASQVMLVIGGNTDKSENTLELYDFEKECWSAVLKIPFRVHAAKLAVIDQKIYLTGGVRDDKIVRTVSSYNFPLNNWQNIPDLIEGRAWHGVAKLDNTIYVFGGWDGQRHLKSGEKFCREDNKWISIVPMFINRRWFGTCVVNDIAYVVGGYDGLNELNSVESYDHRQNKWTQLCSMKERRLGLSVCAIDGMVYAIGGWNPKQKTLRTAERYNPEKNSWTDIAPMKQARRSCDVAHKDNHIYVVGGYHLETSTRINSVEVYNIKSNTWTILSTPMDVPRSYHSVAIVDRIDT